MYKCDDNGIGYYTLFSQRNNNNKQKKHIWTVMKK